MRRGLAQRGGIVYNGSSLNGEMEGMDKVVVVTGGEGRLNGLSATRGDRFVAWGESALVADGHLSAIVSA